METTVVHTPEPLSPTTFQKVKVQEAFAFSKEKGALFLGMTHGIPNAKTGQFLFTKENSGAYMDAPTFVTLVVDKTLNKNLELEFLKLLQKAGRYLLVEAGLSEEDKGVLDNRNDILDHLRHIGRVLPPDLVKTILKY